MDPKGKGMVINDKEKESFINEPKDDKPTDSVLVLALSHKGANKDSFLILLTLGARLSGLRSRRRRTWIILRPWT